MGLEIGQCLCLFLSFALDLFIFVPLVQSILCVSVYVLKAAPSPARLKMVIPQPSFHVNDLGYPELNYFLNSNSKFLGKRI